MKALCFALVLVGCQPPGREDELIAARSALYSAAGWSHVADAGATYRMQDEIDGGAVGLHINTNAITSTARLAEITRDQVDLRAAGNAQNGPGVVGLAIGNRGTAQNPIWVDTGMAPTMEGFGGWSKFMPLVFTTPYVYFNGQGTTNASGPFSSAIFPHTGMGSYGAVTLPWVATIYADGAPDVNPSLSVDETLPGEGHYVIRTGGDAWWNGGELVICQDQGSGCYMDFGSGSGPAISGAGHGRISYDETSTKPGFQINVDGDAHWMPIPVAMQYYHGLDPASATYPTGETIVWTAVPGDTGHKGLRSWDPHRWTLPAAIAVGGGGSLVPKVRFMLASGSSQTLQNASAAPVETARDSLYLALVGTWITEVRFLISNTSAASQTADFGLFQFEASAF